MKQYQSQQWRKHCKQIPQFKSVMKFERKKYFVKKPVKLELARPLTGFQNIFAENNLNTLIFHRKYDRISELKLNSVKSVKSPQKCQNNLVEDKLQANRPASFISQTSFSIQKGPRVIVQPLRRASEIENSNAQGPKQSERSSKMSCKSQLSGAHRKKSHRSQKSGFSIHRNLSVNIHQIQAVVKRIKANSTFTPMFGFRNENHRLYLQLNRQRQN